jgi:hypothetical protein
MRKLRKAATEKPTPAGIMTSVPQPGTEVRG